MNMNMKIDKIADIKNQIEQHFLVLKKLEHKKKATKGILKDKEFLLVNFPATDEDEDCYVPADVLFYRNGHVTLCLNAYFEVYTQYVSDIVDECECANYADKPVKHKKITKEEAMQYL